MQEKIQARDYAAADAAEQADKLETALAGFTELGGYRDSAQRASAVQEKIQARDYAAADAAEQSGDYATAYTGFAALGSYQDSAQRAAAVQDKGRYAQAMQHAMDGEFHKACTLFTALAEKNYSDSADKAYVLGVTSFATVSDRGNGIAAFEFHGLWGLINVSTNTTVSPYWDEVGRFNSLGLARVMKDNRYGYINTQGEVVIGCEWYGVSDFSGDCCTVAAASPLDNGEYNYTFGLMDKDGRTLAAPVWRTLGDSLNSNWNPGRYSYNSLRISAPAFHDGKIRVQDEDGRWGFMDQTGAIIAQPVWSEIGDYSEGLAAVCRDGRYGFIDRDGNVVIQPRYDQVFAFHEGLAAVAVGEYWQYIDQSDEVVIPPLYTSAGSFSSGRADVFLPGVGWQIIDRTGTLLYFINDQLDEDYDAALALMHAGSYDEARERFLLLGGYRDALALAEQCAAQADEADYAAALALMDAGDYTGAYLRFANISGYRDASEKMAQCAAMGAEVDRYTVENQGEYGFALNGDGYYESCNKGIHSSYAMCAVTFSTTTGHIYLDCINSGEGGYDYGIVSTLDTAFAASNESVSSSRVATRVFSGVQDASGRLCTLDIPVPDRGEHVIWIKYIKDSSGNNGNDSLQFAVRFK